MVRQLPVIGVFGQGTSLSAGRAALAREVGAMVGRLGAHLLTGGGFGVMAAAGEGFTAVPGRVGLSIGVIPRDPLGPFDRPKRDPAGRPYPNPFVELVIMTALPPRVPDWRSTPSRNHVNVLSVHAIVALPGGGGTANEIEMTAAYRVDGEQLEDRCAVLLGPATEFSAHQLREFAHAESVAAAEHHVRRILAVRGFVL